MTWSGDSISSFWLVTNSLRASMLPPCCWTWGSLPTNLGNEILSEVNVFGHSMRDAQGDEGDKALDFMGHCICVGHLGPVSHTRSSWPSYNPVNLFLNFLCQAQTIRWVNKARPTQTACPKLSTNLDFLANDGSIYIDFGVVWKATPLQPVQTMPL